MKNGKTSIKKILNKPPVMVALLTPLIEPSGLEDLNIYIGGVWKYLHLLTITFKWISFVTVFFLSFKQLKKWEEVTWLFVAYQGLIALTTMINNGLSLPSISNLLTPMVAALLFQYYMKKGNAKKFLLIAQYILGFYILINLITVIAIPGGMYVDNRMWRDNWILGYRNRHIYYFLPFLAISGVIEYIEEKKIGISLYVLSAITVISSIFCRSTTSMIALILVLALVIFFENINLPQIVCVRNVCIASLLISFLFIFFSYQKYFSGFIENILGKDVTLSRRTLIWARAVMDFIQRPLFGYGMISYEGIFTTWDVTQMHNMFLDMLVVGGVTLTMIFGFLMYIISNKVDECKVPAMKNICIFVFVGYAVLFVTESRRDVTMLFIYMSLCYYLPFLVERYQIRDNKKRVKIRYKKGNIRGKRHATL